jgi:hypothetical protein
MSTTFVIGNDPFYNNRMCKCIVNNKRYDDMRLASYYQRISVEFGSLISVKDSEMSK